ncbi:DUF4198 domain-containing protein [uncultured Roseobacter sp.]|uniref:DUF4198 domain-containing protein n=1 Tax=uncultured Roseobacter sp. TaxID=114847 RepID=UPI002638B2CD|nr:DUF4198 domain-containing protein [uncultured Roseobacter sp.]
MISRLFIVALLLTGQPAVGHEFWIEPEQFQVAPGAELVAHLRNGQNFKGSSLAWFDNRFTRFDMVSGDELIPVEGRIGDTPALEVTAPGAGLLVILHETTSSNLTYKEWEKFLKFADHKDFPDAAADHEAAGWSKERFRETYTRHAKALVAVGAGAGADRAFGLATEFVALTNPYDPAFDGQMRVQVFYQGVPRADAQVEIFDRAADGSVTVSLTRTDEAGIATLPVADGHDYLLDAVVLRPSAAAGTAENAPVWETLWAALTFAVPE